MCRMHRNTPEGDDLCSNRLGSDVPGLLSGIIEAGRRIEKRGGGWMGHPHLRNSRSFRYNSESILPTCIPMERIPVSILLLHSLRQKVDNLSHDPSENHP